MKAIRVLCPATILVFSAGPAYACEPAVPLVFLFGIPLFSLFGVVFVKAIMFAVFEKSLPKFRSFGYMILGNLFSSLIGLVLLLGTVPFLIIVLFLLIYAVSVRPSQRFIEYNPWGLMKKTSPKLLAALITVLYVGTFFLFSFAIQAREHSSLALYWALKYVYILIGVSISIFLTTFWEEYVVVSLAKKEGSMLIPALKANLIAFIIILAFLAAKALPERMKSPNYLIENENQTTVAQVEQPSYSTIAESTRALPEFE
ncbi:MAG TPA: hypothetical protein PKW95_03355 [bacterium]|nr:hypothetical protein [bacterium]